MRRALVLSLLLVWAGSTFAAPPKLAIPPETKATGEYVILQPDTTAKAVSYVGQSGVSPFPSQFLADKRVFILPVRGLSAGRYQFTAVGSLGDEHASTVFVILVGDAPLPPPIPPPVPPDPPKPPIPPLPDPKERYGFVTLARTEGYKLPATERARMQEIASNFEAVAARLAATAQMTVDQANAELRDRNRQTLGDVRITWLPWFTAWQSLADKHNTSGTMSSREHYTAAFQETAIGLRAVK